MLKEIVKLFEKGWNPYSRYLDVDKIDLILRRQQHPFSNPMMFFRNHIPYPGWATRDFALIGYPYYGSIMRHKHLTKIGVKSFDGYNNCSN